MSEQVQDPDKKIYTVTFPCARIAWPAFDDPDYGKCEKAEWDIDPRITARVDIWKCTACEAYPDGYYLSLNDIKQPYLGAEPGDTSNNKHLLCKISFTGVDSVVDRCIQEEIDRNNGRSVHIEYWNKRLPLPDEEALCPPPRLVPEGYTTEEPITITDETPEFVESDDQPTIPSENTPSTVVKPEDNKETE